MQLDKLQIELRPRTNAQALDLGFALLREHAGSVYRAWLALWLPLMALCAVASALAPEQTWLWGLLVWWVKPLLERAPLYVLSRAVFGEPVSPRAALRAWPGQLAGGWFQLMTWGRLIAAGRGLVVPVWQLEHARGKLARTRMRALARDGCGRSAYWFGIVCSHFEGVLQIGLVVFIGQFIDSGPGANPFAFLVNAGGGDLALQRALSLLGFGAAGAIIGPVYTSCTFALYLNRRARLEAWDIEIVLRQIVAPAARAPRALAALLLPLLLPVLALLTGAMLLQPAPALAASPASSAASSANAASNVEPHSTTASAGSSAIAPATASTPAGAAAAPASAACDLSALRDTQPLARGADADAAQAAVRRRIDAIFASDDLRGYVCERRWVFKDKAKPQPKQPPPDLAWLAQLLRALLIAAAVGAVAWLAWRFRDRLPAFQRRQARGATEVAGLDIRASSLPADVAAAVRALWHAGERRAALALLYRATLARLVDDDGLQLHEGATEGDCLRLARRQLRPERYQAADATTTVWLAGAYGDRWPSDATVAALCAAWQAQFDGARAVTP